MNFKEFWKKLQNVIRQGKEFKTLKQKKKFSAHFEQNRRGDPVLRIITHAGAPRGSIQRNEFEGVWNNVKVRPKETRFLNEKRCLEPYPKKKGGTGKSMQVAYITTLIEHIIKVQDME